MPQSSSDALPPIAGPSATMLARHHDDPFISDVINEPVRKTAELTAARAVQVRRPALGGVGDFRDRVIQRRLEACRRGLVSLRVPQPSATRLIDRFRMEVNG